jgi:hypothetical protein
MHLSSQKGEAGLGGAMASAMSGPLDCLDSSRVTTLKAQHPNAPDDDPPRIAIFAFGAAIHD